MKFSTYNVRNILNQERKELRDIESGANIFINEDLTKKISKLLFSAHTLTCADLISAAYSTDGKILDRDLGDNHHLIKSNF